VSVEGGGGEGCGGKDNGEDNKEEEEKDFLEDLLRHVEQELLLKAAKGLNNLEMVRKARKESLYEEAKCCEKRWWLLRFVLDMLVLKTKYGWSDRSFNNLLTLLAVVLSKPNSMPANTYQVKKLVSPLTIGVERIHMCPNHCVFYRGGV
jgi:hypothetical protein